MILSVLKNPFKSQVLENLFIQITETLDLSLVEVRIVGRLKTECELRDNKYTCRQIVISKCWEQKCSYTEKSVPYMNKAICKVNYEEDRR